MFFLRNLSGDSATAAPAPRLRRVATVLAYVSLAVYSLGLISLPAANAKAPKSRKAMVRAETVRLRTAPGKKGKMAALLDAGRVARVLEKRDGWAKLKLASGTTGWVRADLLSINKKKTKDSGAFAAQHPTIVTASRKDRRAKSESVVASNSHKKSVKKIAAKKPVMRPMVARAKPIAKAKPVQIARVSSKSNLHLGSTPKPIQHATPHAVNLHLAATAAPVPVPTPNAQVEPVTTEAYETATLRPGVAEQTLAQLPSSAAPVRSEDVENISAVAPAQTEISDRQTVARAEATIPVTRSAKGKVAPPVKVAIERASKRGDRIVNRALSYRGVPYRMGATGRGAFDCSGFTRYILRQSGEDLPRTAEEQYRKGTPINKDQMRPGDLVFFKNTYKHGVSHVGIYMGDGKFVHASSRGGVRTSNLSESYYVNHWAGARRPNITQGYD